jgi:hypothetical protein
MHGPATTGGRLSLQGRTSSAEKNQAQRPQEISQNQAPMQTLIDLLIGRTCDTVEQAERLFNRTNSIANRLLGEEPAQSMTDAKSPPPPMASIQSLEMHMCRLQDILAQIGAQVSRLEVL